MTKRIILASASPRRKELLALLRLPFDVIPTDVDEEWFIERSDGSPSEIAEELAREKAMDIFLQVSHGHIRAETPTIVLAADTIVVSDRGGEQVILGKPDGADDARRMLRLLSNTSHSVLTGLCLMECDLTDGDVWWPVWNTRVVDTQVQFRELSNEMIEAYLATGEPFDKAGAYGIQGYASAFVEAVHGDYFNVVGLPIQTVAKMLENIGIEWWHGAAALES